MPTSLSNRPIAAITMGDPSGVGPEIILKSLAKTSIRQLANFIIIGDAHVFQKTAKSLGRASQLFLKRLLSSRPLQHVSILDLHNVDMGTFSFGKERIAHGKSSIEYIQKAIKLIRADIADCLVTAPINKSSIAKTGFKFPGHTEFLAGSFGIKKFVMMLAGGPLRVSLVTRHIPMSKVSGHLSARNMFNTITITIDALRKDFSIAKPRIGVCALNPHSGEGGILGNEEVKIIAPAVRRFRKANVVGPFPADALFYEAYRGRFDCLICLYHDQGLIPLKMIARDSGVNVTLGLGFVRTSPDHGTAFDIAGRGRADSRSMAAAIKLAVSMVKNRREHGNA